jgi:diguanylate cyclase (GGDEF)-like protein/PAS domain S-box-containing protein
MHGSRLLAAAIAVLVVGLAAVAIGIDRYDDAYAWVAHTSDVRLVIGRAVGHAGQAPSCEGLRADLGEIAQLTGDNPAQQARVPALQASVARICAGAPAPELIDLLAGLDGTERQLMADRRDHLATVRRWTIGAFALSMLGSIAAAILAWRVQRRVLGALTDSEERFRMLATSSRDLMRIHDAAGRPTYVSPSVVPLLGYTVAEVLAAPPLSFGHPDDLERMERALADVQRPHAPGSTLVYRLRAKDGTYRWFETHTNPIRDGAGALLRFYTTARDITERARLQEKLEKVAVTDELTGLLNRRGFLLIAGQEHKVAMRQQHGVAVAYLDLDGLKTINDRLGHEQGDHALRLFADVLRDVFRESDVVARLGGDEFAALAYDVDGAEVDRILARLEATLADATLVGDYPLSSSVGVALCAPGQASSLDDLLAQADERMYEHKRARKPATSPPAS